jgi:hypothetical protein
MGKLKIKDMQFLVFITAIVALTVIVIATLNHRIKVRMIKAGLADELAVEALNKLHYDLRVDTLKWGVILLFGGMGMIVLNYITVYADSTLPYGIETVFLAAGFITYYLISRKINTNA